MADIIPGWSSHKGAELPKTKGNKHCLVPVSDPCLNDGCEA